MLTLVKSLFSPKVRAMIHIQTTLSPQERLMMQELIRARGLMGCMEYTPTRHVELDLEGTKVMIDALLKDIADAPYVPASARPFTVNLYPYENRFQTFRVSL